MRRIIMSITKERQSVEESAKSVEEVISYLQSLDLPVRSMTVIHDLVAGAILGEVGDVDHEHELAAGVSYVLIGLGKTPTELPRGINFIAIQR
jgi:hypothetical protein